MLLCVVVCCCVLLCVCCVLLLCVLCVVVVCGCVWCVCSECCVCRVFCVCVWWLCGGDRSLASNTRILLWLSGTSTSSLGCPAPGGINLFPSLRCWKFPENLKRTLMNRTLASDPKALCRALFNRILISKMNPETWAGTNHWRGTGVMRNRPGGKPVRESC